MADSAIVLLIKSLHIGPVDPLWLSTFFLAVVTFLGGGVGVQWYSGRAARRGAVAAFVEETKRNARMLNRNIITLTEERRASSFLSVPLVPLETFALDRLPAPLPVELLVNLSPTDNEGNSVHGKQHLRGGAAMYLAGLRSAVAEFNAAVRRHESMVGDANALPGLLAGIDSSVLSVRLALVSVAEYLTHPKDRKQIRGWIDPNYEIVDHVTLATQQAASDPPTR